VPGFHSAQAVQRLLPAKVYADAERLVQVYSCCLAIAECSALEQAEKRTGFGTTDYPEPYRGSLLLVTAPSPAWSTRLWARLHHTLVTAAVARLCRHRYLAPSCPRRSERARARGNGVGGGEAEY
jgi:hypothetical protein